MFTFFRSSRQRMYVDVCHDCRTQCVRLEYFRYCESEIVTHPIWMNLRGMLPFAVGLKKSPSGTSPNSEIRQSHKMRRDDVKYQMTGEVKESVRSCWSTRLCSEVSEIRKYSFCTSLDRKISPNGFSISLGNSRSQWKTNQLNNENRPAATSEILASRREHKPMMWFVRVRRFFLFSLFSFLFFVSFFLLLWNLSLRSLHCMSSINWIGKEQHIEKENNRATSESERDWSDRSSLIFV